MLAINQLLLKEIFFISMLACIVLVSWFCSVMNVWCILILLWVSPLMPLNFLTRMSRSKLAREVNFPMEVAEAGRIPAMKPDNVAAASYCPVCKNSGVSEGLPMLTDVGAW